MDVVICETSLALVVVRYDHARNFGYDSGNLVIHSAHFTSAWVRQVQHSDNFQVGLLAVLKYLSDQFRTLGPSDQQTIRDLVSILNSGGTYVAILRWLDTHYSSPPD
jgi:hypothetical protein